MNHQAWILNLESYNLPITLPTKVCQFASEHPLPFCLPSRKSCPAGKSIPLVRWHWKISQNSVQGKVFLAQKAQKRLTYPFCVNSAWRASNVASLDASLTAVQEECAAILFSSHASRGKPLSANWGLVFFLSTRPRSFVSQWSQLPVKNAMMRCFMGNKTTFFEY